MKVIAILGATGSVGVQAQEVARARGYRVDFMSGGKNVSAMETAAREFRPRSVAMADETAARELRLALSDTDIRVHSGSEAICEGVALSTAETVVNSILGEAGLLPTLATVDRGKRLALANKESLVIAGDIVMARARERGAEIIPVDSEHSAIFQSLSAGKRGEVKRLILTASGGPFFGYSREALSRVTLADTLAHPTWKMGKKITVDSATLMNKGFEIIEAAHLFGIPADRIQVVIHRESILHSAVEYIDNTVIGEMSVPDMKMCVQYAVDYPDRLPTASGELDLFSVGRLTFAAPDGEAFPFLSLARRTLSLGGELPAVMNAADEVAVAAFLEGRIGFTDIYRVVTETVEKMTEGERVSSLDDIIARDREARRVALGLVAKIEERS